MIWAQKNIRTRQQGKEVSREEPVHHPVDLLATYLMRNSNPRTHALHFRERAKDAEKPLS